jgi:exosome complex exonuclease DIS3/RRP44
MSNILSTFHRLTRRGRLQRIVRETYLRDDIPCGMAGCDKCISLMDADASIPAAGEGDVLGAAQGSAPPSMKSSLPQVAQTVVPLSNEPPNGFFIILDTNVVLGQLDVLEAASGLINDVIILQSVMEETKHRSAQSYTRLRALMRDPMRRFCPFANTHHRETFSARRAGESPNDYNDRMIRESCSWLKDHFSDQGIGVVLLTHDAANAKIATASGIDARTLPDFIKSSGQKHRNLLELVSSSGEIQDEDEGDEGDAINTLDEDEASSSSSSSSTSLPTAFLSSSSSSSSSRDSSVYSEHLPQQQLEDGIRSRRYFRGVVRANRDCWFEARVIVHGILGKRSGAAIGSDDATPVLLLGRESMNRAIEGDTVAIELLPQSQWKNPSVRLALPPSRSADDDKAERDALRGASSTAGESASEVSNEHSALAAAAAAVSSKPTSTSAVPTGRVVGIIKRAWKTLCGSFEPEDDAIASVQAEDGSAIAQMAIFVPVDSRYPKIRIETRQKWQLMDKRMIVAMDSWPAKSKYPRGHYVRTIGNIGDKATEGEVILIEHDIVARPFSEDVIACLPPATWTITPENSSQGGRVDLRHIDVCSIDPPGCKDIDDALHARTIHGEPGGDDEVVEVGVHIADVSYFVKHGTAIDIEAAARANTTYLVERRLDMLPGLLTETLCSLKGGVDRFAFSVTWQFKRARGKAVSAAASANASSLPNANDMWEMIPNETKYFRSVIHSRAAMTYGQAQDLLDDPTANTPVAKGVKLLASVARSLKRGRLENGALSLASSEVRILLDNESHDPIDVFAYETKETNSTVEEFMLLANIAVAKRVTEAYPRCSLLRRHPAPPQSSFASLLSAAASVGVQLDVSSSKALAESLDRAKSVGGPSLNRLLRVLATRCMMQAAYFTSGSVPSSEYIHYGLAVPIYTHFTSPIRRYADVIVHRLLAAALEYEPIPAEYIESASRGRAGRGTGGMQEQCFNMNKRHLMSQLAGRASASLHTSIFFHKRVIIDSALIIRLRDNGVVVLVPRFGLEGAVILGTLPSVRALKLDEDAQILQDTSSPSLKLSIFQEVVVALSVEAKGPRGRKELVIRIVEPSFCPFPSLETVPKGTVIEDKRIAAAPQASASSMTKSNVSSSSAVSTPPPSKRLKSN